MASLTERRTQVYLTAEQHREALAAAKRRGISLAGVFREALAQYLASDRERSASCWEGDPALSLVGALELPAPAPDDLDEAVDSAVYGEEP